MKMMNIIDEWKLYNNENVNGNENENGNGMKMMNINGMKMLDKNGNENGLRIFKFNIKIKILKNY